MKQKQTLLAVLAALVVLLGAGLVLTTRLAAEPEETEEEVTLPLTDYAAADITALEYDWQGETERLEQITETVETTDEETGEVSTSEESRWVLADRPEETVTQTLVNSMTTALGTLTASRDLGAAESLADYGLEEPSLVVTATVEGETLTYRFGDTNEVTGEVYLMRDGDESLYTVAYTKQSVFQYAADELIETAAEEESAE